MVNFFWILINLISFSDDTDVLINPLYPANVYDNYLNFGLNLSNFTFIFVKDSKQAIPKTFELQKFPLEKLKAIHDSQFPRISEATVIRKKIFACLQKIKNPEERERRKKEVEKAVDSIMSTSETELICTHLEWVRLAG